MPALASGMKSRWSSIVAIVRKIQDRVVLIRGQARSHKYRAAFKGGADTVGAGLPAKGATRPKAMTEKNPWHPG